MNVAQLARKIASPLIFAHVRAAYPGMPVSQQNAHPFLYGNYLWVRTRPPVPHSSRQCKALRNVPERSWGRRHPRRGDGSVPQVSIHLLLFSFVCTSPQMHNGVVGGFSKIRRRLLETLSEEAYNSVQVSGSQHGRLFGGTFCKNTAAGFEPRGFRTIELAWACPLGCIPTSRVPFPSIPPQELHVGLCGVLCRLPAPAARYQDDPPARRPAQGHGGNRGRGS